MASLTSDAIFEHANEVCCFCLFFTESYFIHSKDFEYDAQVISIFCAGFVI